MGREGLVERARLLAACGDWDAALALLDEALEASPEDVAALVLKGQLVGQSRGERTALGALRRAVELAPRSAAARNGLARALHALGQDDEALEEARRAEDLLAEDDNFREAAAVYLTLVWCLRARRMLREALAAAERGMARCPDGILLQWAGVVEEELAEAERERC